MTSLARFAIGRVGHHPRRFGYSYQQNEKKNKTAVRFKPRCKAHGYSHCPTALGYCFYLFANVQLVKRDIVIAVIYCYITTDFHYSKRDSRLSAYGGVMLQRVGIEKNVNRHFRLNF